jgi:transglutaminase/protease-like cytokinesis protein 3
MDSNMTTITRLNRDQLIAIELDILSSSASSSSGSSSTHSNSPVSSGNRTPTAVGSGGMKTPFSTLNNIRRDTSLIGQTVRISQ